MPTKPDFRRALLRQRSVMPADAHISEDREIAEALYKTRQFADAEYVLAYLSFGSEVDTRGIIGRALESGKTVAAPRCVEGTGDMRWYGITCFEGLERSGFGMEEPVPGLCREILPAEYAQAKAVAIVPGLAFDEQGYRIGYGGGFYDRFLRGFPGTSIGLCRNPFMYGNLHDAGVIDDHDLPVDIVITPTSVVTPAAQARQ